MPFFGIRWFSKAFYYYFFFTQCNRTDFRLMRRLDFWIRHTALTLTFMDAFNHINIPNTVDDSFICCNFILDSILFDTTMSRLQHTPLHSSFFFYLSLNVTLYLSSNSICSITFTVTTNSCSEYSNGKRDREKKKTTTHKAKQVQMCSIV